MPVDAWLMFLAGISIGLQVGSVLQWWVSHGGRR